MGWGPKFPGRQAFEPMQRVAAMIGALADGLGKKWVWQNVFSAQARKPPPTMRPRRGPAPPQPTNAEVAVHFLSARDMTALDTSDVQAIAQTVMDDAVASILAGRAAPNALVVMTRMANLGKALQVHRWERGGEGLNLRALAASTLRRKRQLGQPTQIGTASGQLLAAFKKARVVVRRA